MNRLDRWLTLILLMAFSLMVAMTFQYPAEARLVPVAVGLLGIALCVVQLAFESALKAGFALRFRSAPKIGRLEEFSDSPERGTVQSELRMWRHFLVFVATLLVFGFYIAVPMMVFSYLWRQARVRWPYALVAAFGATAALYLIFAGIFRFVLFPGFGIPAALVALGR